MGAEGGGGGHRKNCRWGTKEKGLIAGWRRLDGGWFHRYAHMDLSGGLGSDTSFEQSHATSKTFKWSSLLLQIKLRGCVCVIVGVCVCVCVKLCKFLLVLVRCEKKKGKENHVRKWLKERCKLFICVYRKCVLSAPVTLTYVTAGKVSLCEDLYFSSWWIWRENAPAPTRCCPFHPAETVK